MNRPGKSVVLVSLLFGATVASAAEVNAGRAAAQAKCVQCHEADDWDGESAASLASIMRDIVAGKVKHKTKLDLTPADIENIAAYWALGKK